MDALKRRIDPKTGLARPDRKGLARELHVSRSTISRRMPDLRDCGLVESVLIPVSPTPFPADDCPQQNPRHAKSPENRECVLGDFLGEFGFRFSPSFPFRPGQRRTGKTKIPRQFVSRDSGLVGAEGFEPSAFCSRSKRATRLRYAPTGLKTSDSIS